MTVLLDGKGLTPHQVVQVAAGGSVRFAETARARMQATADAFDKRGPTHILRDKWAWLAGSAPSSDDSVARAFIEGHCSGVGEPLAPEEVRALMVARANVLATGHSACRPVVVRRMLAMLEAGIVPVVPQQGAIGVGGSVALAHVVQVMAGWGGSAWVHGAQVPAEQAMAGFDPWEPTEKEALSLINGSTLTTALGCLAVVRAERFLDSAEAACALSFEVARANRASLSPLALEARLHPGGIRAAARLDSLVHGSTLVTTERAPDPFSIRCAPAVLGAARDALAHVEQVIGRELNAAVDNPLFFVDQDEIVEAGNFHGAPIALVLDYLKIALTQVASIAERRLFRLTYGQLSGLPSFLVEDTGHNSGFMLAQYTAASLVSECKGLSHPASVDSLPTVQHHEDHVSMGPIAARSAIRLIDVLQDVVAIELLCAAQGLDFRLREGETPGQGTLRTHTLVRERVPFWSEDRVLHPDLEVMGRAVRDGVFA